MMNLYQILLLTISKRKPSLTSIALSTGVISKQISCVKIMLQHMFTHRNYHLTSYPINRWHFPVDLSNATNRKQIKCDTRGVSNE